MKLSSLGRGLKTCVMRTLRGCMDCMSVVQGGLPHVHCMLSEDYSCPVEIIYVLFYPPVVRISQLMHSGDNLEFLPHSFPAPVTSYAVPIIILNF
jgi:hypothetical protein